MPYVMRPCPTCGSIVLHNGRKFEPRHAKACAEASAPVRAYFKAHQRFPKRDADGNYNKTLQAEIDALGG